MKKPSGWIAYPLSLCCLLLILAMVPKETRLLTGAERADIYMPLLQGKRVGLLINQTSRAGNRLLVDVLLEQGVQVQKIFVPEHGFRGTADAGAHVANSRDSATGLPVISLYGNNKKPTAAQLADIDVLVYDLQDVGVRFYTYISTLQYAMEACAENGKTIVVMDRPNPNDFVDGPVLEPAYKSFVGMQPVPVAYGMTAGEYAKMLLGERWFAGAEKVKLEVVKCEGWNHSDSYSLPVAPSPNLKTKAAVDFYPSICLFEGTPVSVGRGTPNPFTCWGHPSFGKSLPKSFKPEPTLGSQDPPYKGQWCYGMQLTAESNKWSRAPRPYYPIPEKVELKWLLLAYQQFDDKTKFFTPFFDKLAGTDQLRKQIIAGKTDAEIRASWQTGLDAFKAIRKKYLLYD